MIRKWLKFNASFVDVLKNTANTKFIDRKWSAESFSFYYSNGLTRSYSTLSNDELTRAVRLSAKGTELSDSDESDAAVAETPARTELFEIKGPYESGFLIEVRSEDLQEVRRELSKLKGDHFHYDKNIIRLFTVKCMLTAEALPNCSREQQRLARVHAIASGSEEVQNLGDTGSFLFVNSVDRTLRAKKILEKLGYKISAILYRFQPKEKISLSDTFRTICYDFVKSVERLPQVISVTHNV